MERLGISISLTFTLIFIPFWLSSAFTRVLTLTEVNSNLLQYSRCFQVQCQTRSCTKFFSPDPLSLPLGPCAYLEYISLSLQNYPSYPSQDAELRKLANSYPKKVFKPHQPPYSRPNPVTLPSARTSLVLFSFSS